MPKSLMVPAILCVVSVGCLEPAAPTVNPGAPPALVLITDVVTEHSAFDPAQLIGLTIRLRNDGGPGSFYLEFRYDAPVPGGQATFQRMEVLNIAAGSSEAQSVDILDIGNPDVVTVYTRAAKAKEFLGTDCKPVRAGAECIGYWDY